MQELTMVPFWMQQQALLYVNEMHNPRMGEILQSQLNALCITREDGEPTKTFADQVQVALAKLFDREWWRECGYFKRRPHRVAKSSLYAARKVHHWRLLLASKNSGVSWIKTRLVRSHQSFYYGVSTAWRTSGTGGQRTHLLHSHNSTSESYRWLSTSSVRLPQMVEIGFMR